MMRLRMVECVHRLHLIFFSCPISMRSGFAELMVSSPSKSLILCADKGDHKKKMHFFKSSQNFDLFFHSRHGICYRTVNRIKMMRLKLAICEVIPGCLLSWSLNSQSWTHRPCASSVLGTIVCPFILEISFRNKYVSTGFLIFLSDLTKPTTLHKYTKIF